MIWRRLFPSEGGGTLRRAIRVQRDLFEYRRTTDGINRLRPLTLFDFTKKDDAADATNSNISGSRGGWRLSDDETIGGYSGGTLSFIKSSSDYVKIANQHAPKHHQVSNHHQSDELDSRFIPFLRFEGATDTTLPPDNSRVRRSGFVAIRSPEFIFGSAALSDNYNALEIMCRADARTYTVNLKIDTYFPDDLFQGYIRGYELPELKSTDNNVEPWRTLVLPFNEFVLTALGGIRELQRSLDGNITIKYIGITVADGVDGDFMFDLARIRAVNYRYGHISGEENESESQELYEERVREEKRQQLARKFKY